MLSVLISIVGLIKDCFIVVLMFTSEVFKSGVVKRRALYVSVRGLFLLHFLGLPVANCHSSVLPSSNNFFEKSEEGSC